MAEVITMAKRKKKQIYLPNIGASAAAGECTGLMPTPARTEEEWASEQDLASTSLPQQNQ
jgi:hypothetical protein